VGTGEHVLKIILLAIGALHGMIGFFVVIFDKFGSLRAEIEPIMNKLRPIDSLFRLGTSRYHSFTVISSKPSITGVTNSGATLPGAPSKWSRDVL